MSGGLAALLLETRGKQEYTPAALLMLALYSVTVGLPSLIAYTLAKRYKQAWRSKSSWLNYPSPLPDLILMVALFTGQGRKHLSQAAARDGGELLRRIIVRAVTSLLLLPPASSLAA